MNQTAPLWGNRALLPRQWGAREQIPNAVIDAVQRILAARCARFSTDIFLAARNSHPAENGLFNAIRPQ
jgi:hypothetical protein